MPLVGRRGLAKLLKKPDDLGAEDREAVAAYLASRSWQRVDAKAAARARCCYFASAGPAGRALQISADLVELAHRRESLLQR